MLAGYAFATVYGYGMIGVIDSAPGLCVLTLSLIAFLFTFFKTNGYLFAFKEYDMLMALPFEPKAVVGCKFLYMYLKNLPLYATVSVAVMIGYGMFEHPGVVTYVMWIILTAFIPLIPMVLASFVGFLIARLSSGFKHKTLVQTVITFIFALFCFSLRFIIEGIFRNDEVDNVLGSIADVTDRACEIYLPAGWFASAVNDLNISSALLLAGVSILIFENLTKAVNEKDQKAIENMALAQYIAGMAFSNCGLGIVHSMAHQLGAVYNTPHGLANAILLPTVMRFNGVVCANDFREILCHIGRPDARNLNDQDVINTFVWMISELSKSVGITQTLKDVGCKEEDLPLLADKAMVDPCKPGNPRDVTKDDFIRLYKEAM